MIHKKKGDEKVTIHTPAKISITDKQRIYQEFRRFIIPVPLRWYALMFSS